MWNLEFREMATKDYPDVLSVKGEDGKFIAGSAKVVQISPTEYSANMFIWHGDVTELTKTTMEEILGYKLYWSSYTQYTSSNNDEFGILAILETS